MLIALLLFRAPALLRWSGPHLPQKYNGQLDVMARASGVDLSMLAEVGDLDPADETSREYERVADPKYLDQIRTEAKQFSNKLLSRQSGVARSAIMNFKKGRNTIKPRTLRKLTKAIHSLQKKKN